MKMNRVLVGFPVCSSACSPLASVFFWLPVGISVWDGPAVFGAKENSETSEEGIKKQMTKTREGEQEIILKKEN